MDRLFLANAELSKFCRSYMELKKGLPIRPSEMGMLNIITQTPGSPTHVMLAEFLGVSKPMITAHLNALADKGYITKQQSVEDKRAYYIIPTEKALGREDFDILVRLAQRANQVLREENRNGSQR